MAESPSTTTPALPEPDRAARASRGGRLLAFLHRRPFLSFYLLVLLSNAVGSYFNIAYNRELIVEQLLSPAQKEAFWRALVPGYNLAAYGIGLGVISLLLRPLERPLALLRAGQAVPAGELERARRLLINLPAWQVFLNLLGWLPGAAIFPLGVCLLGGAENARSIAIQFAISFTISALLTTMQTFFLLEAFLTEVFYPHFFRDARPSEVRRALRLPMGLRIGLLWGAVAVVPLLALLVVALNFSPQPDRFSQLRRLALGVTAVGLPASAFLMGMLAHSLLRWMRAHQEATSAIGRGDYGVRIAEQRPDEWGLLTERFNDMAAELERGHALRETFGQFLSPEVRDEVLAHYPGLGGEVRVVTVLFADIRGFARRSAGADPQRAVELLNRFFSLSVAAVEEKGGWVNKFLGDGILALFGAPRPREDHADLAVEAAFDLLERLSMLQGEELLGGQTLEVGIGIHTGTALVGCVGATWGRPDEARRVRREFTAIGETVNIGQRLEQMTKVHGGPILLSEDTRAALRRPCRLEGLGLLALPGTERSLVVHRAGEERGGSARGLRREAMPAAPGGKA